MSEFQTTDQKVLAPLDTELEDPSAAEDEEVSPAVRYSVSSYGADYPVDGLVKRMNADSIKVPQFQRGYVWSWAQASRFIESLLIGLPVPGIFLSKEAESERMMVIDGQQRLRTLQYFYEGLLSGKEFKLRGVRSDFEGVSYKTLSEEDRRKLDDSIIHATVIRQDDPEGDQGSIYLVFERLNTGGTPLSPQEIRICVFEGSFMSLLARLNELQAWRDLYGPVSRRAKDQELILRFFALYYDLEKYERPMKVFLSKFAASNRKLQRFSEVDLEGMFKKTVAFAMQHLGPKVFRPVSALNASYTDALLIGTARRLRRGSIDDINTYKQAVKALLGKDDFAAKCRTGTTDESNVRDRLGMATEAIGAVS